MAPRIANPSDADAITNVIINTMPLDPQWDYRFPYRHIYPGDHYKYTRMLFDLFVDPSYDDWLVMVSEDIHPDTGEFGIVSFSVWDVSYRNKRVHGPSYKPQDPVTEVEKRGGSSRRDANHEHFNAFWKGQIRAYKMFFGHIGPEQMHLQIIATLPECQGRGHASSLCRWGMDLIQKESLKDISVMASPMGQRLYSYLGFEEVGSFFIQVPGEEEKVTLQAMMYKVKKICRR